MVIRARAERRAGELLIEMRESGARDTGHGDRKSGSQDETPKLADFGITKTQSSRWRKLAELDGDEFERRVATAKKQAVSSVEATAAERAAEKKERREEREAELGARQVALPDAKFGVILADPEWRSEPWSRELSGVRVNC